MIYGFKDQGVDRRPEWANGKLHLWYFMLRVERPKSAKRRKLYRWIAKEKLRLAELNIDQELIDVTCRYLSSYSVVTGRRMIELMDKPVSQLSLDLHNHDDF
ncbi:hypothetical protein LG200_05740 [Methylobacillus caricis]|uniref:hypothetical protein n=1 Tax=Methylobacillus caricis TaxID=1971611 RepID=UPI001CFF7BCA|nr:hypothetical protein [Methylobacillus caricis]MCB5187508.1 hypothetical protein [Methylobacillus caricis]